MPIPVTCPACGCRMRAPDTAAGKTAQCQKCKTSFVVPAPAARDVFKFVNEPDPPKLPPPKLFANVVRAEVVEDDDEEAEELVVVTPGTRPCKHCGHAVAPSAKKCPGCGGTSPCPLKPQEWLMGCIALAVIGVLFTVFCTRGEKKSDQPPPRGETSSPGRTGLSVEVVAVRLEPFRAATGFDTQRVCVDWKNTSDRPIRVVRARIKAFDDRGIEVFSVPSYTIYATLTNDQPGVAPGETYRKPPGEGFILPKDAGRSAVRATAEVTSADERLRD